jgi:hypothetical protein
MRRLAPGALVIALALVATAPAATSPAPRIAGTTLEGKPLSLRSFRGKPVLINVWSSW